MRKLIATHVCRSVFRAGALLTLVFCMMDETGVAENVTAEHVSAEIASARKVTPADRKGTTHVYTHRDLEGVAPLGFITRVMRLPSIDNAFPVTTVSHKVATGGEGTMEPVVRNVSPIPQPAVETSGQPIEASSSHSHMPFPPLPQRDEVAADEAWMATQVSPSDQVIALDDALIEVAVVDLAANESSPAPTPTAVLSPSVDPSEIQGSTQRLSEADEPSGFRSRRLPSNIDMAEEPAATSVVTSVPQPPTLEPLAAQPSGPEPVRAHPINHSSNQITSAPSPSDQIRSEPIPMVQFPSDQFSSDQFSPGQLASSEVGSSHLVPSHVSPGHFAPGNVAPGYAGHPEPILHGERVSVGPGLFERTIIQPDWSRVFGSDCLKCAGGLCCCRQSVWTATTEFLFLSRSKSDAFDNFLAECHQTGDGTRGRDVELDPAYGPRITITRNNLCGGIDFEGVYYQIEDFAGSDAHFGELFIREVNLLDEGTSYVDYESRIRNAELNASRYVTNWTKLLVGVRWLQIEETASITASTLAFPDYRDQVDIENNMIGGQVGIQHVMWDRGNGFSVTGTTKLGILSNEITRDTFGFGVTGLSSRQTSLLGEFDINAVYQLTRRWSFNAGYQLLAISDVGLALDQFFSPAAIYNNQEALLHGVRLGISFSH